MSGKSEAIEVVQSFVLGGMLKPAKVSVTETVSQNAVRRDLYEGADMMGRFPTAGIPQSPDGHDLAVWSADGVAYFVGAYKVAYPQDLLIYRNGSDATGRAMIATEASPVPLEAGDSATMFFGKDITETYVPSGSLKMTVDGVTTTPDIDYPVEGTYPCQIKCGGAVAVIFPQGTEPGTKKYVVYSFVSGAFAGQSFGVWYGYGMQNENQQQED